MIEKAAELGIELDDATATRVIGRVKELEHEGYQFEAADGSLELLLRREAGAYEPLFTLESWRVIVEQRADGEVQTEATIKIWIDGERRVQTAEGNGPVNALDRALRAAIGEVHPHLADIELVNFKVRILDEDKGTGAVTRVLLDASDGAQVWGSIGVVGERRRGVVGGAGRLARARHARRSAGVSASAQDEVPLAQPVLGAAEEERGARACCAPGGCRSDRCSVSSSGASRRASARRYASAVSSGTAGLHLALRAVGRARRRRGRSPARSPSSRRPTRSSTSAPGRCSSTSTRAR